MEMTRAEVKAWKESDQTKEVFRRVQKLLDEIIAGIANGSTLYDTVDETAIQTAKLSGRIAGLSFIFNIEDEFYDP